MSRAAWVSWWYDAVGVLEVVRGACYRCRRVGAPCGYVVGAYRLELRGGGILCQECAASESGR